MSVEITRTLAASVGCAIGMAIVSTLLNVGLIGFGAFLLLMTVVGSVAAVMMRPVIALLTIAPCIQLGVWTGMLIEWRINCAQCGLSNFATRKTVALFFVMIPSVLVFAGILTIVGVLLRYGVARVMRHA